MSEPIYDKPIPETNASSIKTESLKLGNLNITAIIAEHQEERWSEQEAKYREVISKVDVVIPEYFTPEWADQRKDPLLVEYVHINDIYCYFSKVEKMVGDDSKRVLVLDPAHDQNFALINLFYAGELGAGTVGAMTAEKLLNRARNKTNQESMSSKNLSRRTFLKGLAVGSLGLFLGGALDFGSYMYESFTKNPSIIPNEAVFRRDIVSRGISQFEEQQKEPINVAVIYPETHWRQIKDFFNNPISQVLFKAYSSLKTNPGLKESFFTGREYKWNGKEFVKDGQFEIV